MGITKTYKNAMKFQEIVSSFGMINMKFFKFNAKFVHMFVKKWSTFVKLVHVFEELGAKMALVTILDHPSQNLEIIYFLAMLQ